MARIYSFMPRPPAASRGGTAPHGAATIIIFPGVRYERRKDGDGAGSNGAGPAGPKSARNRR